MLCRKDFYSYYFFHCTSTPANSKCVPSKTWQIRRKWNAGILQELSTGSLATWDASYCSWHSIFSGGSMLHLSMRVRRPLHVWHALLYEVKTSLYARCNWKGSFAGEGVQHDPCRSRPATLFCSGSLALISLVLPITLPSTALCFPCYIHLHVADTSICECSQVYIR